MRTLVAPNQIVIQFKYGIGETAGEVMGVSLSQLEFVVEEGSAKIVGRIDRGRQDAPQDFPREELRTLLGEMFETFEAQHRVLTEENNILKIAAGEREQLLASVTAERDALKEAEAVPGEARWA